MLLIYNFQIRSTLFLVLLFSTFSVLAEKLETPQTCTPCTEVDSRYLIPPEPGAFPTRDAYWEAHSKFYSLEGTIERGKLLGYTPEQTTAMLDYAQAPFINRALTGQDPMTPEMHAQREHLLNAARPAAAQDIYRGTNNSSLYPLGLGRDPVFSSHSTDPNIATRNFLHGNDQVLIKTTIPENFELIHIDALEMIDGESEKLLKAGQLYEVTSVNEGYTLAEFYNDIGEPLPDRVDPNKKITYVQRRAIPSSGSIDCPGKIPFKLKSFTAIPGIDPGGELVSAIVEPALAASPESVQRGTHWFFQGISDAVNFTGYSVFGYEGWNNRKSVYEEWGEYNNASIPWNPNPEVIPFGQYDGA